MKRLAALVAVLALVTAACGGGSSSREHLRFGAAQSVGTTNGPIVFTVAPNGDIYYAELRTNAFHYLDRAHAAHDLFTTHDKPDSLVVDRAGVIYVAARTRAHKLTVNAYRDGNPEVAWHGPASHTAAHLLLTADGKLVVGFGNQILELTPTHRVIGRGYTDPVLIGGRERVWVADNEPPGGTERFPSSPPAPR